MAPAAIRMTSFASLIAPDPKSISLSELRTILSATSCENRSNLIDVASQNNNSILNTLEKYAPSNSVIVEGIVTLLIARGIAMIFLLSLSSNIPCCTV